MSVFGVDFIGPLFHNLFPDRSFDVKKMSVPSATAILSYIRLSYPNVKPELDAAIALGNRVLPAYMILLVNLRDLFEYFIPTVGLFVVTAFPEQILVLFSNSVPVFKMPFFLVQILCRF